jgi:outer membrane protein
MNKFASLLIACTLAAATATAREGRLKIATVDVQRLFKEYHRTQEARKEINVERARLQKDGNDRLAHIRELDTALQRMRKELDDPSVAESRKQSVFSEWRAKQQEGIALERERRDFLQRRNQALNEKMVQRMRGILDEVRRRVEELAKAGDFDYVFDQSGLSTTQVPFFLVSRGSTDLTDRLLKDLNAGHSPPAGETKTGSGGENPVSDPD